MLLQTLLHLDADPGQLGHILVAAPEADSRRVVRIPPAAAADIEGPLGGVIPGVQGFGMAVLGHFLHAGVDPGQVPGGNPIQPEAVALLGG